PASAPSNSCPSRRATAAVISSRPLVQPSTAIVPSARWEKLPCRCTRRPSRQGYRSTNGLPSPHDGGGGPPFKSITSVARREIPALRTSTRTLWRGPVLISHRSEAATPAAASATAAASLTGKRLLWIGSRPTIVA